MAHENKINDIYPAFQDLSGWGGAEIKNFPLNMEEWRNGFVVLWMEVFEGVPFGAGSFEIILQEKINASFVDVPADRISIAQVNTQNGKNPLIIVPPGGLVDGQFARTISVKDFDSDVLNVKIESFGMVPSGINLLLQVWTFPVRVPVDAVQIEST